MPERVVSGLTIGGWRLCPSCANARHDDHDQPCACDLCEAPTSQETAA